MELGGPQVSPSSRFNGLVGIGVALAIAYFAYQFIASPIGMTGNSSSRSDLEIGATAEYDGFRVTMGSVERPTSKDLLDQPILIAGVVYENTGDEAVPYSEFDWYVETIDGARVHDIALVPASADAKTLGSGEVAPGGHVVGVIVLRCPDAALSKLVFIPSFLADEEAKASWVIR